MKYIVVFALAFALGMTFQYRYDSYTVSSILQSDDSSIIRNVEQANALLDVYEQELTKLQQQIAKDRIKRDAEGKEIQ